MSEELFRPGLQQDLYLCSKASRPALEPTQHPLQWVPEVIPPWVKWPGCGADHYPKIAPMFRMQGTVPPLPYNFMAYTETTLHLCQRLMVVENILSLQAVERHLCFCQCYIMLPLHIGTADCMKLFSVLFKGAVNR
jgi:hypothetical protein